MRMGINRRVNLSVSSPFFYPISSPLQRAETALCGARTIQNDAPGSWYGPTRRSGACVLPVAFANKKTDYSLRGDLCPLSYESGTFGAKMLKSKKNQRGSRAHSSGFARLNARSIPLNLRSDPLLFMFPSPPFSCPPTPILRSRGTSRGTSPKLQC